MQAQDIPILRGAAIPTLAVGAGLVALFSVLDGWPGFVGAALGLAVVLAFFSISWYVISTASAKGPAVMMGAAFATYIVKIVLLGLLLISFRETTAFDFQAFAWTILVGVICWTGFQVLAFMRQRILYVDPEATEPRLEGRR
jgi:ATP synthase protein I